MHPSLAAEDKPYNEPSRQAGDTCEGAVVQDFGAGRRIGTGRKRKARRKEFPFKDAVLGIYRNGRIELDEQPEWPDGQRVAILVHLDGEPIGTGVPRVELPDGRMVPFNDSPEHCKLLGEQMVRPNPIEWTPEEEASFSAALEDMDRLYRGGLRKRTD